MNNLPNRLALAILFTTSWLSVGARAEGPSVDIQTEYLMTLEAPIEAPQVVGSRLIVNVPTGGSAHGPKINGDLIPPAGDWLVPMPDGSLRLDVRGTIKTDDGQLIFVEYNGILAMTKDGGDRFNKGEAIGPKDAYFITAPRFSTTSKKYEWLNQIQAVGKMTSVQAGKSVKYDIFAVH